MNRYDLGDLVPLGVEIRDTDGDLADATEVTLTVVDPAGASTDYGPVASTSTGVYAYDYTPATAGRYVALWVATGVNQSTESVVFTVTDATTVLATVSDLASRIQLGIPDADLGAAQSALDYAHALVVGHCRHTVAATDAYAGIARGVVLSVAARAYVNALERQTYNGPEQLSYTPSWGDVTLTPREQVALSPLVDYAAGIG